MSGNENVHDVFTDVPSPVIEKPQEPLPPSLGDNVMHVECRWEWRTMTWKWLWRSRAVTPLLLCLALATGCSARTPEGYEFTLGNPTSGGGASSASSAATATAPGGDFESLLKGAWEAWKRDDFTLAALLARRATAVAMRGGQKVIVNRGSGVDGVLANAAAAEAEAK